MKRVTELPQGKFQSAVFQLSQALGDEGAGVFIRIDSDPIFRSRVAEYMIAGAPEMVPTFQGLDFEGAVAIMGRDKVIGPKEVERFLGITIDPELMRTAGHIPYKPSTLALYAKTHLLVFGCNAGVSEVALKSHFDIRWAKDRIDADEPVFLTSAPRTGWFLISKKPDIVRPDSDDELVTVAEAYYMYSLHKETNRTHCFLQDHPVICRETTAGGEVYFGLGSCFWKRYAEGSHDYTVLKKPQRKPKVDLYLRVVQPDNPLV